MKPDWYPDWRGRACVIVASGPSAKDADLESVRGKAKVLAINTSWQLAQWADALYGCDCKWWTVHSTALQVAGFSGLKITVAENCDLPGLKKVKLVNAPRIVTELGSIGSGSNSGFQATNLAVQFGANPIIWVGFDMRLDHGTHWHGDHPEGLNNPRAERVERWRRFLDDAALDFKRLGVRIFNASIVSALKNYPKMSLAEAIQQELVA